MQAGRTPACGEEVVPCKVNYSTPLPVSQQQNQSRSKFRGGCLRGLDGPHLARVAAHHSDHILAQLLDVGELREVGSHFVKSVHSPAKTAEVSPRSVSSSRFET